MGRTFAGMEDHHTLRLATPEGYRWILEKLQFVARWPLAERERVDEEGGLGFEPFPFPLEFSKWVCAGWKYARSWS